MPIDAELLRHVLRHRAMARLEAGLRAGGNVLCTILKASVSVPTSAPDATGPAEPGVFTWHPEKHTEGPYLYGSPLRRTRRRNGVVVIRDGDPPYMRSGAGRDTIGFQIVERDFNAGRIVIRIGVNGDAPGGTTMRSYMLAHEAGIRYPTNGPDKGTGPKLRRRWLRPGIKKYWAEFASITILTARGIA